MEIYFDEENHEYRVQGEKKPSVTEILHYISGNSLSQISPAMLAVASERGSAVHELTERIDYGMDLEEVPSELEGYVKAYLDFLRDYKPKWLYIEKPVYSDRFDYCGTLDRYGIIDGRECVVDIKTNSSPTTENYISVSAQTAAYDWALNGEPKAERRYALYLKKNGEYRLFSCEEFEKKREFNGYGIFKECYDLWKRLERIKKWKR